MGISLYLGKFYKEFEGYEKRAQTTGSFPHRGTFWGT
jgi:hypothetical protein